MYKQPLFGEDSSPHITSMLVSAIVTLVCWIIFCVLCLVIKFKPQTPQYKEVQIVLSSTPVVEKEKSEAAESAPAAAMQEEAAVVEPVETTPVPELPKPVETPVAEAKVEAPKKDAAPAKTNTASTKSQTQTTKADDYRKIDFNNLQYATDMDEAINNQFNNKSAQTEFRDDLFSDDIDNSNNTPSNESLKVSGASGMSGIAGASVENGKQGISSKDQAQKAEQGTKESAETARLLAGIQNATPYTKRTGDVESKVVADTTKSNGYINMKMSDGTSRSLLEPLNPSISLDENAAREITNKIVVYIRIPVSKDGYVSSNNIEFLYTDLKTSAESLIPKIVRQQILAQLGEWIFEPASTSATATFEYTVEKR